MTRRFLPIALATGTATFIGRLYFGLEPAFRLNLSVPAFAIIGMAAMVGGGTGAAMAAVTPPPVGTRSQLFLVNK